MVNRKTTIVSPEQYRLCLTHVVGCTRRSHTAKSLEKLWKWGSRVSFICMATADSGYAHRNTVPLGSLASNWVIWKTLLCRLSWVSIFNLEEKKITALLFICIKIYGAGWFPGCCFCRALLWWCMPVTCHQPSWALMIHCSNKSFVIHHSLDSCPDLSLYCVFLQGALAQNKFHVLVLPRASLYPCISYCL